MPQPPLATTIDVEDYFQVSAFAPYIARTEWDSRECRVERNIDAILAMLAKHRTHATFFTLGWIAERYPQLVRQIVANGQRAGQPTRLRPTARQRPDTRRFFRSDVDRAKKLLEDLSGQPVQGYRAPSFLIGKAICGLTTRCSKRATATAPASTRLPTTTMACRIRRGLPRGAAGSDRDPDHHGAPV